MPGLLQNHIAAVTGARSGIGRAISRGFAREGASVAALDVDGDTAAQTVALIRAAGGTAEAFNLDITDRAACDGIATEVSRLMGPVSVLVNNAGINRRTPFTGDPANVIKDWSDIMAVNLDGMFNVTHAPRDTARDQGPDRQHRVGSVIRAHAHTQLSRLHHGQARRAWLHPRARR
jgi:NAD(P)-dependent dehydrogenase (short-subunit alcohol dehydrogenase family)